MANTLRIKRRAAGGASGAPSSLANAELAFNEQDTTLYYGVGTGGAGGSATSVIAIGGSGAFAALASPALTGSPTAPTAAVDTNTTQIATTAFVLAQAGSASPLVNGTVAVGTSTRFARQDHVHASDTSRAALASPTFTGTPLSTTAAVDTNTTQIATTAFVLAQASAVAGAALGTAAVGTSLRYARADHVHAMPTLSQAGAPTADIAFGSFKITSLADPTNAQDAATKNYVDNVASGLDAKPSVRAATTANITLSATQTIDGISVIAGDRVLVKNQTTTAQNGIYVVAAGAWSRSTDTDTWLELISAYAFVESGTTQADTGWVSTVDAGGTIGTTAVAFAQFSSSGSYSAGNGLTLTGNTFDVVGTASRISVAADSIDISTSYVGQSSITTLGTITTGVWNGTAVTVANGGTGAATLTGYVKGTGTAALTASATIPVSDISSGAALTKVDDTNVTLTLGGTPTTALLAASSITVGWSGQLAVARGGTGAATLTGYVKGAGTTALTAAATIPSTDITGLGTMSTQAASGVAITGGSITNLTTFDGITIDGGTF